MFLFDRNVSLDSVGLPSNGRRDHKKNSHVWNTCGSSEAENSHSWNGSVSFPVSTEQSRGDESGKRSKKQMLTRDILLMGGGAGRPDVGQLSEMTGRRTRGK